MPRNTEAAWWDSSSGGTSWMKRQKVPVVNNSGDDLASGTTVAITVNTKDLVSQGKLQSDCDDLRVVHSSGSTHTEMARYLSYPGGGSCPTSEATKVYFKLNAALTNTSTDANYYIYYGNSQATTPSNSDNAFDIGSADALLVCPFDGTTTCAAGETPSTATGAIRYSGSKSAMSFDGNDDTILITTNSSITNIFDNTGTVDFWIKFNPASDSDYRSLFRKTGWSIKTDQSGGNYRLEFYLDRSIVGGDWITDYVISPNQWTHVSLIYNSSSTANDPLIYINGTSQSLTESQTPQGSRTSDSPADLIISTNVGVTRFPSVIFDEVRLSNIARYTANFTPPTSPFVRDEHTKLLYHFDENGDDPRNTGKAIDDSGNGNHGTITGAKYVAGLVGVDNGTTDTGKDEGGNTYGGHEGIFIEEPTTNKITNPSFEHATYNTAWDAVGANLTASENTTAPFYKFGSKSLKLIASASAISGTSNMDTIGIDPNSTASHTFFFYAYDATSGNIGGTISSSIVKPVWQGTAQGTGTYTDMGGGWWRVSYTAATTDSINEYGVEVQVSKTVYIDGVQLEGGSYAKTYADGSLTSSAGGNDTYFWDDNCDGALDAGEDETADQNTQCSSRKQTDLRYATSGNLNASAGTISFWAKANGLNSTTAGDSQYFVVIPRTGGSNNNRIILYRNKSSGYLCLTIYNGSGVEQYGGCTGQSISTNSWFMATITWSSGSNPVFYFNGSSLGNGTGTDAPSSLASYICVGGYANGDGDTCSYQANSLISDFRTFSSALTSAQVSDLYYSGLVSHSNTYEVDAFSEDKGQNPVGIYHFDEGYGSTAHDSSIYNNDLTVTNTSWSTLSADGGRSQLMRNLKFDGSTSVASASASVAREMNFETDLFTISGWFRHPSTVSGTDTLVAKAGNPNQTSQAGYKVYMNSSGYLCFAIDDDTTFTPDDSACSNTQGVSTSYADSKWHHFEAVKDTSALYLYIDGNKVSEDLSLSATASLNNNANFAVGVDSDKTNFWDGFIDDIIIYPYARSSDQAKTDFTGGQTGSVYGLQANDPLSQGLVGYWKMDEAGDTDRADSSGNGNNLTESTSDTIAQTSGKYGNAGDFVPGETEYLYKTHVAGNSLDINSSLTLSAWVNLDSKQDCGGFITKADDNDVENDQYFLGETCFGGDNLRFLLNTSTGNSDLQGNSDLSNYVGTWTHFVGVFNASNKTVEIFINGVSDGKADAGDSSITTTDAEVRIGAAFQGFYLDGKIDEVRIYNRALSPAEVQSLYNWAPGPVAYYKFDEGTGTTSVNDSSGNGNTGTMNGSMTESDWVQGKFGSALDFDGSDDRINAGSASMLDNIAEFTVTAWIKPRSLGEVNEGIIVSKENGGDSGGWLFRVGGTSKVNFNLNRGTQDLLAASSDNAISFTEWKHVAVVYDNSLTASNVKLYSNGVLHVHGFDQNGSGSRDNDSTYNLMIGNDPNGNQSFNGLLDDVKIYNYARTQTQIIEDMNAGHPAPGSPVGSPVGYWKFDEGYGTAVNDLISGRIMGMTSASWTNNGKYGKAWNGTGSINLTVSDDDELDFGAGESFSISMWIKSDNSTLSGTEALIDKRAPTIAGYSMWWSGSEEIGFGIDDDTSWTPDDHVGVGSGLDSYDGNWHHIVVVKTTNSKLELYVDGTLIDTDDSISATGSLANSQTLVIADDYNGSDDFTGDIDEFKIYRLAMTPDQVKTEYNQGKAQVFGSTSTNSSGVGTWSDTNAYCPPGQGSTCTAPVAEWKFDEKTGQSAYDTSTNGNSGTLGSTGGSDTNDPTWQHAGNCKNGACLSFDGSDDYSVTSSTSIFDATGPYTLEAWIYPRSWGETGEGRFIARPNLGFTVSGGNESIKLINGDNASEASSTIYSISLNTWQHVAAVYDGSGTVTLYINGINKTSDSTITESANSSAVYIGCEASGTSLCFNGLIDNPRIFNYARTPTQVAWDYNQGGPAGWWKLDECTGTVANDSSGNGNNGTITPGTGTPPQNTAAGTCSSGNNYEMWNDGTSGKRNASLGFDGSDDYVNSSYAPNLGTSSFSISSWFKTTTANWNQLIGSQAETGTYDEIILFEVENAGGDCTTQGMIGFFVKDTDSANNDIVCSKKTYHDGNWHHVVGVFDQTAVLVNLYIDGILAGSTPITSSSSGNKDFSGYPLYIGAKNNKGTPTGGFFNGQIDDVKVFNYALTSQQVKDEYNSGAVHFGP